MRYILIFITVVRACSAGRLQIILPNELPFDSESSTFDSDSLFAFNKHVLGIGNSADVSKKIVDRGLFVKPKALVVISIIGLENFNYDGRVYNFTDEFEPRQIQESLKQHFGEEMIHADVNSSGVFGSHFKRNAAINRQDIEEESDSEDIQNMNQLADVIREKDRKKANVVDYYRIHLDVSNARSLKEKQQLEENIKRGIDTLQDAIKNSYGGNVVAEIYTHEEAGVEAENRRVDNLRKIFEVTRARNVDHPASSAIIMLTCVGMVFAAMSMLWFMFDDSDMGKNSLVYRLSTARQKKD